MCRELCVVCGVQCVVSCVPFVCLGVVVLMCLCCCVSCFVLGVGCCEL